MANRKARMRKNKVNSDIRREGRALEAPKTKKDPAPKNINPRPETMRFQKGPNRVGGVSFLPGSSEEGTAMNLDRNENRRVPRSSYKMPRYDETEVDVSPRAEREEQMMLGKKYGGKVKKMKAGGKVRGAGIAQKGVRACQMR